MKIKQIDFLIQKGNFSHSDEFENILNEVKTAVKAVVWPLGSNRFTLYPKKNASGVVPIKKEFMSVLVQQDWMLEHRMSIASRIRPGPIDAVKKLSNGQFFAVEWETGNISSSHRAINKMAVGLLDGVLAGGILILPSREMYQYLTDRIGNYAEIEPYFPVWRNLSINKGVLAVIEVEHDAISLDIPPIKKGTDGRALR
ncbi:MAG: restriction endonuclease [Desulfobacteraceae bacterium]|nr:restriction endonuclease [Desulfobacteraceae bacterium]MBC2755481.1 restriction endonuclease [Desulfobacteraceae bacterium]